MTSDQISTRGGGVVYGGLEEARTLQSHQLSLWPTDVIVKQENYRFTAPIEFYPKWPVLLWEYETAGLQLYSSIWPHWTVIIDIMNVFYPNHPPGIQSSLLGHSHVNNRFGHWRLEILNNHERTPGRGIRIQNVKWTKYFVVICLFSATFRHLACRRFKSFDRLLGWHW